METTSGQKEFGVCDDRAEECISCLECRKKCPTAAVRLWG
jgi:ferredoxin